MSDFLKSLFVRSFGLEEGLETVRPRLPSLFEPSHARPLSADTQAFADSAEVKNTVENRASNPDEINSLASGLRSPGNVDHGTKEARPITPIVPPHNGVDKNLNVNPAPDQLSHSQPASLAKSQGYFNGSVAPPVTEDTIAFSKQEPVRLNLEQTNAEHGAENTSIIAAVHKSPIATQLDSEPGFMPVSPEVISTNLRTENAFQAPQKAEQSRVLQATTLVADMSVLKQLVKEQVSLHTQENPGIGDNGINTASNHAVILPQAEKFNTTGLGLTPVAHPFENSRVNSAKELEPTIHVTIGRIEIRATPPSSIPMRKNTDKKSSAMSLEDYLNKRNGGAR